MANIGQMLDAIAGLEGVEAALIAGRDGLIIEGRHKKDTEALEALSAVSSSLTNSLESMASDLSNGNVRQAIIEFDRGMAIVQPVGDLAVFTVVLDSSANLGRVRLALRKNQRLVEDALAQL